jgi:hypothetical protein
MTTSASVVTGVDFVSVPTKSFAAAMEFYGTLLGLPCGSVYQRAQGAEFETGNLTRGVLFRGETLDTTVCYMAFLKDPDGNALMLHQRYAPSGPHA